MGIEVFKRWVGCDGKEVWVFWGDIGGFGVELWGFWGEIVGFWAKGLGRGGVMGVLGGDLGS